MQLQESWNEALKQLLENQSEVFRNCLSDIEVKVKSEIRSEFQNDLQKYQDQVASTLLQIDNLNRNTDSLTNRMRAIENNLVCCCHSFIAYGFM